MKEKGADPAAEDYGQSRRRVGELARLFTEDLGVEEACHGDLRKDEEAESTNHRPSTSEQVRTVLFPFIRLWSPLSFILLVRWLVVSLDELRVCVE